jgi:hypothetical protein
VRFRRPARATALRRFERLGVARRLSGDQEDRGRAAGQARSEKSGGRVWLEEIHRYVVDAKLEGDVQDVFIVSLQVDGASLKIRDEQGAEYRLPLAP